MILRSRGLAVLTTLATLTVLVAGAAGAAPATPEGKTRSSSPAARAALADARAVLAGDADGRDASMALLELWRQQHALSGADRAAAARALTRPLLPQSRCTADNCFHWTTTGTDAVPPADGDGNGVPDYVDDVAETVDHVRRVYLGAGYRAPKPDGVAGGNAKTDIYLTDVGSQSLYGYCTSDMPLPAQPATYDAWAYCVLDNDYDPEQFSTNSPLENLQVTAAHEYFHAVQYAYDAFEDGWLMEATATWAEDELYDDVDDNVQYLSDSPLTHPAVPLDTYDDEGSQYGTWSFFRFLTERLDDAEGGMPTLVRDVWEWADGAAGGPDDHSMRAVARVLEERGTTLPLAFGLYASANRLPHLAYEEGAALDYPSVAPAGSYRLSTKRKDSGWKAAELDHLSAATARFVPGRGLSASAWKLKIFLDLPAASTDPVAVVTVVKKSGAVQVVPVPVSRQGDATKKVAFGSSGVRYVEVTLANAGSRYECWQDGPYSCQGFSADDGRRLEVRAKAVR